MSSAKLSLRGHFLFSLIMAAKQERFNIWKQLKPPELRRLAFAVLLIFAIMGPIQVLMLPTLKANFWFRWILVTFISGGFAAAIILTRSRISRIIPITLLVTITLFALPTLEKTLFPIEISVDDQDSLLSTKQLEQQKIRRMLVGMSGIVLLVFGYTMFIFVIGREGKKRVRLETELNIAQNIQKSLLPSSALKNNWLEASGLMTPTKEVGGDYFDFFSLPEDEVAAVIADVSGHGTGTGIISAMTKSAIIAQLEHAASPKEILQNLNKTLYKVTNKKMFVTCAYVLINALKKEVKYATAGHPPILIYRKSKNMVEELKTNNLGLGLKESVHFNEASVELEEEDVLLLYTDGIIEAMNPSLVEFEVERLKDLLEKKSDSSSQVICQEILDTVRTFSGTVELKDDATIMSIKITS